MIGWFSYTEKKFRSGLREKNSYGLPFEIISFERKTKAVRSLAAFTTLPETVSLFRRPFFAQPFRFLDPFSCRPDGKTYSLDNADHQPMVLLEHHHSRSRPLPR